MPIDLIGATRLKLRRLFSLVEQRRGTRRPDTISKDMVARSMGIFLLAKTREAAKILAPQINDQNQMTIVQNKTSLFTNIVEIVDTARQQAYRSSNSILLSAYWKIGKLIVEDEQQGVAKAKYGKAILKNLASKLTVKFGKGFDERNLNNIRAFYLAFPIWNAVRTELSWTHYRIISRLETLEARLEHVKQVIDGNWNSRILQRNIKTKYIDRILDHKKSKKLQPRNFIKDPYIFEFLGLSPNISLTENKIETALINHLQHFLMELGKGFAFVARQQHVITDSSDFYIDLVFYNYHLKCFVLVDLKTHKLTHEAIGQMDMYVRMYDDLKREKNDNPTIGLILCSEKDETIVKYSVLSENKKLFASKYRLYLPKEDELKRLIEEDRVNFELDN
jgi:predicted nuclease of restriction endonuclease-like (RecB) superfamily